MENRYDKYKDSGIAWIGEIPEHWEVRTLKTMLSGLQDGTHGTFENIISNYLLLSAKNITDNGLQFSDLERTISENDYKAIVSNGYPQKGDILLCCVGTIGRCCIYNYDKIYAFQRSVSFLRTNKNESNSFLLYLLRSQICTTQFLMLARTSAQSGIYLSTLANLIIVTPSLFEQQSIAAYLDQKCGEIDELITLQEEMITKLQSYKQSVITEAVTKGLDKNVPLKDSGIEWIGEIPEHWEVKRLKNVCSQINIKENSKRNSLPYIGLENIESGSGRYIDTISEIEGMANRFCKNNVLFGKLRPYLSKVYLAEKDGICSPEFIVYDTKSNNSRFIHKLLLSQPFIDVVNSSTYGAKMPRANGEFINNIYVQIPPLSEQQSIADYLDQKCSEIDELISIKQQKIEKLKEYKKSLIFECVTGKRKVS